MSVVGVTSETTGPTEKWVDENGMEFAYAYDKGSKLMGKVGASGYPSAILVNAGCANACTGAEGDANAARSAELVAKTLGLTLEEIVQAMATLPNARTPTKRDWDGLANLWRDQLDERIRLLQDLREKLSGCIGCGCLSLKRCTLYNADDRAAARGGTIPGRSRGCRQN